jgi:hypothetical protein
MGIRGEILFAVECLLFGADFSAVARLSAFEVISRLAGTQNRSSSRKCPHLDPADAGDLLVAGML